MTASASNFVVPVPERPQVPVVGEAGTFPVRRIWCVGRNYADHAREMGHDPTREAPFFFAKPGDAIAGHDETLSFPSETSNLHHEVELAVAIGAKGVGVDEKTAEAMIYGYAVALDMTRRDLQRAAKQASRPWAIAKGFDQSCPIGALTPIEQTGLLQSGSIHLDVNAERRQEGDLSQMIWSSAECISYLSRFVELHPGDLVLTGTPAGVGAVQPGDRLEARIEGLSPLSIEYREA